jgi:hypothetical protein
MIIVSSMFPSSGSLGSVICGPSWSWQACGLSKRATRRNFTLIHQVNTIYKQRFPRADERVMEEAKGPYTIASGMAPITGRLQSVLIYTDYR